MYEGDVVIYNLSTYGFDIDVVLEIIYVKPHRQSMVFRPVQGAWPEPFHHWRDTETLDADHIRDYLYTIAPSTPTIHE